MAHYSFKQLSCLYSASRPRSPPVNPLFSEARRFVPTVSRGTPVVYILRLQSGVPYIGASIDLEQRLNDHVSGRAGRTTSLDPPAALLRLEVCSTFAEARRREAQLKRWSRQKKESLIAGNLVTLSALSRSHRCPPTDHRRAMDPLGHSRDSITQDGQCRDESR